VCIHVHVCAYVCDFARVFYIDQPLFQ